MACNIIVVYKTPFMSHPAPFLGPKAEPVCHILPLMEGHGMGRYKKFWECFSPYSLVKTTLQQGETDINILI